MYSRSYLQSIIDQNFTKHTQLHAISICQLPPRKLKNKMNKYSFFVCYIYLKYFPSLWLIFNLAYDIFGHIDISKFYVLRTAGIFLCAHFHCLYAFEVLSNFKIRWICIFFFLIICFIFFIF